MNTWKDLHDTLADRLDAATLEDVRRVTAPVRHDLRVEATLAAARDGGRSDFDAALLLAADLNGIGGRAGAGGPGGASCRMPVFAHLGKGRWRATDGDAWRAAGSSALLRMRMTWAVGGIGDDGMLTLENENGVRHDPTFAMIEMPEPWDRAFALAMIRDGHGLIARNPPEAAWPAGAVLGIISREPPHRLGHALIRAGATVLAPAPEQRRHRQRRHHRLAHRHRAALRAAAGHRDGHPLGRTGRPPGAEGHGGGSRRDRHRARDGPPPRPRR